MRVPVKDTGFVKDTTNGALLTVNRSVLLENKARIELGKKLNSKNDEINKLKEQVESINRDVSDIKDLLKQLIQQRD
jgi:ACT domain-containing protein